MSERIYKVAALAGDGIGPEVMREALKVLRAAEGKFGFQLKVTEAAVGWAGIDAAGKALPDDTLLYCAHEYTAANARFALHADPENEALARYADEVAERRDRDLPTVPTRLKRELAANPFLRADDPDMQARWGGGDAVATFAALRAAKDNF